ncbi:hypothetical protein Hanom_Chr07g00663611 [Helianthus anomalus]
MEATEAMNSETLDNNHQISQQHNEQDHQNLEDNTDPITKETEDQLSSSSSSSISQTEILRAVEVVQRNSVAISDSFSSLFASLRRLALSNSTESFIHDGETRKLSRITNTLVSNLRSENTKSKQ